MEYCIMHDAYDYRFNWYPFNVSPSCIDFAELDKINANKNMSSQLDQHLFWFTQMKQIWNSTRSVAVAVARKFLQHWSINEFVFRGIEFAIPSPSIMDGYLLKWFCD